MNEQIKEALQSAMEYIEYAIDVHGPDPAGKGLETLNKLDKAIKELTN